MTWFSFLHGNEPPGETVLVAGLGNPGEKYAETRHNMGFKVIDALAETLDVQVRQRKFGGRFAMTPVSGKKLILLKPWEFMNRSGQAVATTVGFYKLPLDRILVVYDDMALAVGQIRVRARGSAGGHNGLSDIIAKLKSDQFARCRVGIGSPDQGDAIDYVLGVPSRQEQRDLDEAVIKARQAVLCWLDEGINTAMNRFNGT